MITNEFRFFDPLKDDINTVPAMGGKTKREMLSERSEVGSRDVSVSYGAMS